MTATLQRVRPSAAADPSRRLTRGQRLAVAGLLAGTALLFLSGLAASGWANAYYSAAAQAGAASWKALFFGATDAPGGITLDKTPGSVWVMALSVRLFGLSSWSVLVPQALAGVATVFGGPRRAGPVRLGGRAGMGGLLNAATPGAQLVGLLRAAPSGYTWVAATVGSNNAAGYQLATGLPVLAVGGFNGTDPAPTLVRFQQYVRDGRVRIFLGAAMTITTRSTGGSDASTQIARWVAENYPSSTVDGVLVYDLDGSQR